MLLLFGFSNFMSRKHVGAHKKRKYAPLTDRDHVVSPWDTSYESRVVIDPYGVGWLNDVGSAVQSEEATLVRLYNRALSTELITMKQLFDSIHPADFKAARTLCNPYGQTACFPALPTTYFSHPYRVPRSRWFYQQVWA